MKDFLQKVKAITIGHAVADALGVPVEFTDRERLEDYPVTDMEGYGTYNMPKGTWSDDTSMAICALDAFSNGGLDLETVMDNFCKWYYQGEYTPTGIVFDVGNSCRMAIMRYCQQNLSWKECGVASERDNGNGSLMRIYPFVLYTYLLNAEIDEKIQIIEQASALTHAHKRSKIACGIYAFVLWELLNSSSINSVCVGLNKAKEFYKGEAELKYYNRIFDKDFTNLSKSQIKSSGYVVDSLEAALWCLLNTEDYKNCVLKAVNLGEDTDTVGAIAGSLAGALYGYDSIPQEWKTELIKKEYLEQLCKKVFTN